MIRFNDGVSHIDYQLVMQIVDGRRQYQQDIVRVRKVADDDGFVLVLKNASRGRKITVCNPRNTHRAIVEMLETPPLTARTIGQRVRVCRRIPLENASMVRRVVPEMRKFLHGGDLVGKVEKIQAVENRDELTDDNVYVAYVQSYKRIGGTDVEPIYDLRLENGETVRDKLVRSKGMEEAIDKPNGERFVYLENKAGEHRVCSARFFNWKFELSV